MERGVNAVIHSMFTASSRSTRRLAHRAKHAMEIPSQPGIVTSRLRGREWSLVAEGLLRMVWPILHEISVLGSHGRSDCSRPQSRIVTTPGCEGISMAQFPR